MNELLNSMEVRVYIFEDEKDVRNPLAYYLKGSGFVVYDFDNPRQFSQKISCRESKKYIDVVLTDIQMPQMDGMEFIEHLLNLGCSPQNIAVISGYLDRKTETFLSERGIKVYKKPHSLLEISEWLNHLKKNGQNMEFSFQ